MLLSLVVGMMAVDAEGRGKNVANLFLAGITTTCE
jgi:hypothetical protein